MLKFLKKAYFILLPLSVTAIALIFKLVRYGAVDDILMYNMATSFDFNSHSEQLMFLNIGYGYLLKLLYSPLPAINWFSVLYLILFNVAFITIQKVVSKYEGNLVYAVILSGVEFYLITRISFTVNAFLLACAGAFWLLSNVSKLEKKSIPHIAFSSVLFILGFAMRNGSTLYCTILILIPVLVFAVIKKRNTAGVIALLIVISFVANFGVVAVHKAYNKTIPQETYFAEFQKNRSAASDEGRTNYKKHKKEFKKAGLSKNDLNIFKQFVYGDREAYTSEKLEAISSARDFKDRYNINPIKILKNVKNLESPIINYIFWLALFAVVLFILYKKQRLEIFSSAFFTGVAELYLFVRRRGVARVVDPIAALGIIVLIFVIVISSEKFKEQKLFKLNLKKAYPAIVAAVLALTVVFSALCAHTYNKKFVDYSDTVSCVEEDKEHIYLAAPLSAGKLYDQHLTLLNSDYDKVPIYAVEGDWWIYSYYWYSLNEKLGLSEYNEKAINSILDERVRFISRNKDLPRYLVKFYKEHYNLKVDYTLVNEFNGKMKIYEIREIKE